MPEEAQEETSGRLEAFRDAVIELVARHRMFYLALGTGGAITGFVVLEGGTPELIVPWLVGAILLGLIALFGAIPVSGDETEPAGFAPRFGGIRVVGMLIAAGLLICCAFIAGPDPKDGPFIFVSGFVTLFQAVSGLLALLALRSVLAGLAGIVRLLLRRFGARDGVLASITAERAYLLTALLYLIYLGVILVQKFEWALAIASLFVVPGILAHRHLFRLSTGTGLVAFLPVMCAMSIIGAELLRDLGLPRPAEPLSPNPDFELPSLIANSLPFLASGNDTGAGLATIVVVLNAAFFLLILRKSPVAPPQNGRTASALAINPEASRYVGDDGHAERLADLIARSNAGVIGITGVRGAGKSALLSVTRRRFGENYCAIWTTAPVSYQDDEKLSFLLSVSRALCQKALDDAGAIVYGSRGEMLQAVEEFLRSIRRPILVFGAIIGAIYFLFGQTNESNVLLGKKETLTLPERFALGDTHIPLSPIAVANSTISARDGLNAMYQELLTAERSAVRGLSARVRSALADWPEDIKARVIVTPVPETAGFDLLRLNFIRRSGDGGDDADADIDAGIIGQLAQRRQLVAHAQPPPPGSFGVARLASANFVSSGLDLLARDSDLVVRRFAPAASGPRFEAYLDLQILAWRHILERKGSIYLQDRPGNNISSEFEQVIFSLGVLRGEPRVGVHLASTTATLHQVLGIDRSHRFASGLLPTEWASLMLFAHYFDTVEVLSDSAAAAEAKNAAWAALTLNRGELQRLHVVLQRYLSVLDGGTLPGRDNSIDTGAGRPSAWDQHLEDRTVALFDSQAGLAVLILLGICLLPEFLKGLNFAIRGALNFRILVLMRKANEFLEFLNYSEGREASASFGFRGLNLGGKRTLAARNLTLQSLTDRYQDFVSLLLTFYNGKLIVIVDEMDKMSDPDHVKNVLRELKGALFQRGCYYLISISEDAANAFRGRLAEGRDIFESTFDDIIDIRQMGVATAREMVAKRLNQDPTAPDLEAEAVDILTVFSGAIPREIVRHLRDVVLKAEKGATVSAQEIGRSILTTDLEQWKDSLMSAPFEGQVVVQLREEIAHVQQSLSQNFAPGQPWPEGQPDSPGIRLARCQQLLDPEDELRGRKSGTDTRATEISSNESEYRQLAERQTCLRLQIMNLLMRHIWTKGALSPGAAETAILALRAVSLQPAVAIQLLEELATDHLQLFFPE